MIKILFIFNKLKARFVSIKIDQKRILEGFFELIKRLISFNFSTISLFMKFKKWFPRLFWILRYDTLENLNTNFILFHIKSILKNLGSKVANDHHWTIYLNHSIERLLTHFFQLNVLTCKYLLNLKMNIFYW